MAEEAPRPNIRIEIHNNLADESMEVDEVKESENEDGEISDEAEETPDKTAVNKGSVILGSKKVWPNSTGGFTTGINIFDKEEQEKLMERAKRFQLKPNEIKNFTDEQLQDLHDSLGISEDNEKDVRFEAIHMRGTDEMSTEDVFRYFSKYGPIAIEWINDESCNVVWTDKISTARALFYLSSSVKGMPATGPCDPFSKDLQETIDKEDGETGRSILLKNENRAVELKDDTADDKENSDGTISLSDISVPIPPGYWRLGVKHDKAKCILLRFTYKSDKKPYRAEKFSEYYKKYGNPNYGGIKGIISESHRLKSKGIFDRNRAIRPKLGKAVDEIKNPWGELAENWDEDAQYAERIVIPHRPPKPLKPVEESSIMNRLGFKRAHIEIQDKQEEEEVEEEPVPQKKSKVPRMRMYADEEEEKIKRRKKLMAVKMHANLKNENEDGRRGGDLRNILKPSRNTKVVVNEIVDSEEEVVVGSKISEENPEPAWQPDLGSRLKNRTRRPHMHDLTVPKERLPVPAPLEITVDNSRAQWPKSSRHHRSERRKREESPPRRHRPSRYDTLHSDRQETRARRRRDSEMYDEEQPLDRHKPRSKVAVVIKTQKRPTVASQVWSRRMHSDREEQRRTVPVKSRVRKASTSSSEESSTESSSSSSTTSSGSSSEESSESGSDAEDLDEAREARVKVERPGFYSDDLAQRVGQKSPLRIEINNDHFKKE